MSGLRRIGLPSVGITIGTSLCARLLFAAVLGYGVDEAYAVSVARPMALSYFDHPPLHFWVAGTMSALLQTTRPLVVRLPFLAMFCLTLWVIADLTRQRFGEHAARIAAVALAASGVPGMTSGTWVLPDGPLLCGSAVGVWALSHVLGGAPTDHEPAPRDIRKWWLVAGTAFGVAALSKYHALLLVAGVALYVLTDPDERRQLRTPWPWIALVLVMAALIPVLRWNASHDWASFRFHGARARAERWSLAPFAEMQLGQMAWLFPWIAIPLWRALASSIQVSATTGTRRLLLCTAAGPVLLFSLVPLGGARGLPHWTAPGWLFVFPMLGAWGAARLEGSTDRATFAWPRWLGVAVAASAVLLALTLAHVRWGTGDRWLDARARDSDPTRDAVSWAPAIDPTADVLLVRSWIQGGQAGAASARATRIVCLCTDPHHFAYRPGATIRPGDHGLLLERVRTRPPELPATAFGGDSLDIVLRDTVRLERDVRIVRYDVKRRRNISAGPMAFRAAW